MSMLRSQSSQNLFTDAFENAMLDPLYAIEFNNKYSSDAAFKQAFDALQEGQVGRKKRNAYKDYLTQKSAEIRQKIEASRAASAEFYAETATRFICDNAFTKDLYLCRKEKFALKYPLFELEHELSLLKNDNHQLIQKQTMTNEQLEQLLKHEAEQTLPPEKIEELRAEINQNARAIKNKLEENAARLAVVEKTLAEKEKETSEPLKLLNEKEQTLIKNIECLKEKTLPDYFHQLRDEILKEAKIDMDTAVQRLRLSYEFYYQAAVNNRLANDSYYAQLKKQEEQLTEEQQQTLNKMEDTLKEAALSKAKGVDITQPVTVGYWDKLCAQYNPVDRPGEFFFPLEKGIIEPTQLGTAGINLFSIGAAINKKGPAQRELSVYRPLKPLLALQSVASATNDFWSLTTKEDHIKDENDKVVEIVPPGKRDIPTCGGGSQIYIPVVRGKDFSIKKEVFTEMLELLPKEVLQEALYKYLDDENIAREVEQRIETPRTRYLRYVIEKFRALIGRGNKSSGATTPVKDPNQSTLAQKELSAKRDITELLNHINFTLQAVDRQKLELLERIRKTCGEDAHPRFLAHLSGYSSEADFGNTPEQKNDFAALKNIYTLEYLMQTRKETLDHLLENGAQGSLYKLSRKIAIESEKIKNDIEAYKKRNPAVHTDLAPPKTGLWDWVLRKLGILKENPRKAVVCAAAIVATGGIAAKIAIAHAMVLGTYKIAAGLAAGSAAGGATGLVCQSKAIQKTLKGSLTKKEADEVFAEKTPQNKPVLQNVVDRDAPLPALSAAVAGEEEKPAFARPRHT